MSDWKSGGKCESDELGWLPQHAASLHLTHNQHRAYYQSAAAYIEQDTTPDQWASEAERQRAIETDEIWELQWYPSTPVGFCALYASSLAALRAALADAGG